MKNSIGSNLARDPFTKISPESIFIACTGDVMIGRLVNEALQTRDPASIWGDVLPLLAKADLRIINFEAALTTFAQEMPKVFNFKTDPKNIACLTEANIDAVNIANNHILDYTVQGLYDSLNILDQVSIKRVGAGKNLTEARKPAIFEKKGIKIGLIGCTDNEPSWEAKGDAPGTFYLPIGHIENIQKEIKTLRQHVDFVIISIHWGPNMRERPTSPFKSFAHQLIDAGADLIHGHSAHIFQGVEIYRDRAILYDTGDFIDDYAVNPYLLNDRSFLFLIEVMPRKILSLRLIPVYIEDFSVHLAQGKEKEGICHKMRTLSHEMGTEWEEMDWGLFNGNIS